jgi:hypothetical protein
MVTMTTMIDYQLLLHRGGGGGGGGGSAMPQFNLEVVEEHKLAGMICVQPLSDICGIVEARRHCCHSRGLLGGGRGLATCTPAGRWDGQQRQ